MSIYYYEYIRIFQLDLIFKSFQLNLQMVTLEEAFVSLGMNPENMGETQLDLNVMQPNLARDLPPSFFMRISFYLKQA